MNTNDQTAQFQQLAESVQSHMTKMLKLIGFNVVAHEIKKVAPNCPQSIVAVTDCPSTVDPNRIMLFIEFLRKNGFATPHRVRASVPCQYQSYMITHITSEEHDLLMKLTEEDVNQFIGEEMMRVLSN